jgi:hypothetical protein
MKLHLTAKVPNEGARLVAQWILGMPGGLDDAATALGTSADWVQRMVGGDMVPGLTVGTRLARHTGVRARDFHRSAQAGWFERPASLARAA